MSFRVMENMGVSCLSLSGSASVLGGGAGMAQALGVSRQTVISLEKGKYNPSLALAFKLARYFGLPIEAIFDDSDESPDAKLQQ